MPRWGLATAVAFPQKSDPAYLRHHLREMRKSTGFNRNQCFFIFVFQSAFKCIPSSFFQRSVFLNLFSETRQAARVAGA